ncbi:MAG TPA: substrate-binding domain-containing protein [Tepidisphaeraceae bacterium]|jgi:LacI family transcriptional regulator|nr:substrate-binding domain-containing protein [Tepidisphaeraceae bacterium]
MSNPPHIAVAVETLIGRELLIGCADYAHTARWGSVSVIPWSSAREGFVPNRGYDGAVFMIWDAALLKVARGLGCPIINVSNTAHAADVTTIQTDDRAIGRLAADHLIERGLRQFGAVKSADDQPGERVEGFLERLAELGFPVGNMPLLNAAELWQPAAVLGRLRDLPKPIGFFCFDDDSALWLIRACDRAGLSVPNAVAVLGCDDIDSIVAQASPSLSSIALPWRQIGNLAAASLHALIDGRPVAPLTRVPPSSVMRRGSTQINVVDDPEVTHALQVMRTAEGMRMTVGELADGLSMTRRTLERRFRDLVGTSPASEQRRLRIERACVLLTEGDLPIHAIARELGFAYANHFSTAFIATMRISPTAYRAARSRRP